MLLGNMNFLLAWIHWGLAVLLSLSTVQLSRTAPTPGDAKPTEVVPFMKVFQQSICQVRETMVDIYQEYPDEVEYIFKPSCVLLKRCSGCCNDETLECVPAETYNTTMQIMSIKPHKMQHIIDKSFQQHSRCECRLKKEVLTNQEKKGKQGKGLKRKRKRIRHCEPCKERRKHMFVQDPLTCKCSCKYTDSRCKTRQLELNERTCRRDTKPRAVQPHAGPSIC
ncbi:vascular endothelial growth factor A, long form isoform X2 [Pelobates fuscus]|uniref:vascular endothelial growth factor A, long form isoform X2 n=1 Tax=Pelobates fuscus TaxID=191477 RepID=UPI002FE4E980